VALEGTHIRFAVDTKDDFSVTETDKYIAGSIYPDSRYPTGVDRTLTHDDSQMKRVFWHNDDFRSGWAAHLLYDKIQFSVHTDWFKNLLKEENPEMTSEEDWVVRTALKILQDIDDVRQFDIKEHLNSLTYFETPNGENDGDVRKYNQLFIDIYTKAPNVSIEDLEQMWIDWSISTETASRMRVKSYEIMNDSKLMDKVRGIYGETMKRKDEFFNRYCQ
jgi:hypothetical protein